MERVGPREWTALRAIILIARAKGEIVSTDEIAGYLDRSKSYTEVILTKLRQKGFLVSNRGPRGGYILGIDPKQLTVHDILSSIRDPTSVEDPLDDDLTPVIDVLNEKLRTITIESLL